MLRCGIWGSLTVMPRVILLGVRQVGRVVGLSRDVCHGCLAGDCL